MCHLWSECPTVFRISVLSRSFMSMLKASSFNCGPRLQKIVIHARPGRSQSFKKRWETEQGRVDGRQKRDKQMLRWLKKTRIPTESYCHCDLWGVKVQHEGCIFTTTLRPDLVKKANMEWKMLSLSWGMVQGVGFLCGVQLPLPSVTWNRAAAIKIIYVQYENIICQLKSV